MPKRATMNISVPPAIRDYIADRVSEGPYASASEYVRELVRRDRERRELKDVEAKLVEGLESGPARELTKADWAELRGELERRIAKGKKTKSRR